MKKVRKKKSPGEYFVLSNVIYLLKEIAADRPFLFALIVVEVICTVAAPVIGIYLPSYAVTLVTDRVDVMEVLLRLGALGMIFAIVQGLRDMAVDGKYILANGMRLYFQKKLLFRSLHCDYVHTESKEGMTLYQRAMDTLFNGDWSGTSRMLGAAIGLVTSSVSFAIYFGILADLHLLVVIAMVAMSIVNLVLYRHAQNYEHAQKDNKADINQKLEYVEYTARDISYAKDIRLYSMNSWFLETRERLTEAYSRLINQIRNRFFAVTCFNNFSRVLQNGLAYGYLIWSVLEQRIGVNEFVLYFGAIRGFSDFVGSISDHFNALRSANLQMNDMRKYMDVTDRSEGEPENVAQLPDADHLDIEFDHVWFSYEKDTNPVLRDFCLKIEKGEKLALVGINGAGKTTIVKLLCGFYRPQRGMIRIGGVDIRQFSKEDLYKLFSAVFQDLYIDPFTVAENISMSLEAETDMERVEECLNRTGLLETIRSHPRHLHANMTNKIRSGIVLSGGQQQKLLMSRALYKEAPIMILDEPTAALDPIAESETYENFHGLTGDKTVIYISHRLASTRFCDRIVFLKDGKNAECGTHEELVSLHGEYAKMFEVQSHYYKEGGNGSETEKNMA